MIVLLVSCLVEPRLSVTGVTLEILTAKVLPIRYDIVPQKLGQRIVMKEAKNLLINQIRVVEELEYLWWLPSRWKYLPQKFYR